MKHNKIIILSVFISLVIHVTLLAISPYITLGGMSEVKRDTRKIFRIRDVEKKPSKVTLFKKKIQELPTVKMSRRLSPQEKDGLQKMILENNPKKDMSLERKKKDLYKERMMEELPLKKGEFGTEHMMRTETEKIRKELDPKRRPVTEDLLSEDLVSCPVVSAASGPKFDRVARAGIVRRKAIRSEEWKPYNLRSFQADETDISTMQEKARIGSYEDISKFLNVKVYTYTEQETGEKYFKCVIAVKEGSPLEVIPKEVIFLIDSSKSITEKKLTCVKKALLDALGSFNPRDRINVVAFRGDLVSFSKRSVLATKKNIEKIIPFIKGLKAVGQTDVENALQGIIDEPVSFNPSYIVLITDGRPTTGATDSRHIIQEITRKNSMVRPLFCFGGGKRVNRYLLDFISYQNRAWSRFALTTNNIKDDFSKFYGQIKNPILLNVRYRMSGLKVSEVYPKYLSDFYYGKPFTLYGRFKDEDIFSMQLLGEMNGSTKEFIFKRSLKGAQPGSADIATEWAFRKMYYLISRNTMGKGKVGYLRAEIDRLSKKYSITTPYDIEDGD